jgi:hemolysin activation/secretion protein
VYRAVVLATTLSLLAAAAAFAQTPRTTPRAEPRFTIERYQVEGATMVSPAALQAALAPLTGPSKRFADIEQALEAVRAVYDRAGITAMQVLIPQQTLRGGVVKLQVEEFKLAGVEVAGSQHRDPSNIRRAVPALKEGTTPSDLVISEQLRLANENPGRQMEVTFRTEDDGKLVGVMRVADRESLAGQMSLDNTGSASTGRWRLGAALQHHNLFNRDVVGTLQMQTSPGYWQEVQIISASARVPLYRAGWILDASALKSRVDSGSLAFEPAIGADPAYGLLLSNGENFGLKLSKLLPRINIWEHKFSIGIDVKKIDAILSPDKSTNNPLQKEITEEFSESNKYKLRIINLGYQGTWKAEDFIFFAIGSLNRNAPSGSDSSLNAIRNQRDGRANPHYRITRLTLSAAKPAFGGQASASFSGQWTPDALVAAEQFGIGGDGSIRGFNGRVASNDQGERLGLEWQSPMRPWDAHDAKAGSGGKRAAPGQPPVASALAWGWQVFLEAGQVRRNDPQPRDTTRTRLAAVGSGLRLLAFDRMSVRADLGVVVRGDGLAERGDRFLHVAATVGF